MARSVKELSVAQLAWHLFASLGGNVWMWMGNWAGSLFLKPRGCWVSVRLDAFSPNVFEGGADPDVACSLLRLLVVNRSPFPVVVTEAGFLVRWPGRAGVEFPLLGVAAGDINRYEIAAKSKAYLAVDACSGMDAMTAEVAESIGWDDEEIDPRFDWGAYVRLDSGRVFRSYSMW